MRKLPRPLSPRKAKRAVRYAPETGQMVNITLSKKSLVIKFKLKSEKIFY